VGEFVRLTNGPKLRRSGRSLPASDEHAGDCRRRRSADNAGLAGSPSPVRERCPIWSIAPSKEHDGGSNLLATVEAAWQ